jgi:hypothetical protein
MTDLKKQKKVTAVEVNSTDGSIVDIHLMKGPKGASIPMKIATIDLSELGKDWKRHKHEIHHVYVLHQRSGTMPTINERLNADNN